MGEIKGKISAHLRSAQKWLNRAEQAFESEKDTKGKLSLMLAQAELQHIQETTVKDSRFFWARQVVAFSLAALVVSGGIGGAYFYLHQQDVDSDRLPKVAETKPLLPAAHSELAPHMERQSVTSSQSDSPQSAADSVKLPQDSSASSALPPVKVPREQDRAVTEALPKKEAAQVVQPAEMQKLIREAGKSLRGQ